MDGDGVHIMVHSLEGPTASRVLDLARVRHAADYVERVEALAKEAHDEVLAELADMKREDRLGLPAGRHDRGWPR